MFRMRWVASALACAGLFAACGGSEPAEPEPAHLPPTLTHVKKEDPAATVMLTPGMTVDEAETRLIRLTLEHTRENKTRAAEILGISLKTLHNKLNRLRGRMPGKRPEEEAVSR